MAQRHNKKGRAINGILLLDKAINISSNQALQKVKYLFQAKKAGHTGSLDPLATGMLPICFGEATKFSTFLLSSDKCYLTTATLGATTSTGDAEGEVTSQQAIPAHLNPINNENNKGAESIERVLETFRGAITQIPPMHSALKHQGKPLYELARKGIEIERKSRDVFIHQLELLSRTGTTLDLNVTCSKGTYIRTLVEDIGRALNCGAYVSMLRRSYVEPFDNQDMFSWKTLQAMSQAELDSKILPIDAGLKAFPGITLDAIQSQSLLHGQNIRIAVPDATLVRIYNPEDEFLGVGVPHGDSELKPKRLVQQATVSSRKP